MTNMEAALAQCTGKYMRRIVLGMTRVDGRDLDNRYGDRRWWEKYPGRWDDRRWCAGRDGYAESRRTILKRLGDAGIKYTINDDGCLDITDKRAPYKPPQAPQTDCP